MLWLGGWVSWLRAVPHSTGGTLCIYRPAKHTLVLYELSVDPSVVGPDGAAMCPRGQLPPQPLATRTSRVLMGFKKDLLCLFLMRTRWWQLEERGMQNANCITLHDSTEGFWGSKSAVSLLIAIGYNFVNGYVQRRPPCCILQWSKVQRRGYRVVLGTGSIPRARQCRIDGDRRDTRCCTWPDLNEAVSNDSRDVAEVLQARCRNIIAQIICSWLS